MNAIRNWLMAALWALLLVVTGVGVTPLLAVAHAGSGCLPGINATHPRSASAACAQPTLVASALAAADTPGTASTYGYDVTSSSSESTFASGPAGTAAREPASKPSVRSADDLSLARPVLVAAETGADVVNAAGRAYPRVLDPRTGDPIPAPPPGLSKVPVGDLVPWGAQQRGAYIKEWYDQGYSTPEGGWSQYDIHHIIPREYGGTNDFNNLVPVLRTVHQQEFNPWWMNYGG